ncbi:MAG: hypothetical protein EOP53_14045 [Sphingobacteriales bacterium]|nr:MAG: hypothetical protein EOP53_14045 [Sphingobacteriales bacterium]
MDEFDKGAIKIILSSLRERLGRELKIEEEQVFSAPRSGMAYEMIIGFITDLEKPKNEIEFYITNVVSQHNDLLKRTIKTRRKRNYKE